MNFHDPRLRAGALERLGLLQRLVDDLTDIAAGTRPTPIDLAEAVTMHAFSIGHHRVPCLIGAVSDHPRLGSRVITTSQLFYVDPDGKWARTFSRFYRLENGDIPACDLSGADT
jgi:hypothetical protein